MIYSPLIYPGSKRRVMNEILPLFPDNIEDWVEPFMGGLSVTLAFLQSSKSRDCKTFTVGDLNKELYSFWLGVQQDAEGVYEAQKEWFNRVVPHFEEYLHTSEGDIEYSRIHQEVDKEIRELWNDVYTIDTERLGLVTRAARLYLCNRISFSGLGDSGNVSVYMALKHRVEKGKDLIDVSKILQGIEIVNTSFEETVSRVTKNSFVFFDPPYYAQEGTGLYGRKGDLHRGFPHKLLGQTANKLGCKWMVTYDDSPYVRRMFRGRNIDILRLQYSMHPSHDKDSLDGEELIITNYDTGNETVFDF